MNKTNDFIDRLEKELYEQTRNGREDVFIEVEDLNKLGYGIDKNKTGRVYVDARYFKIVLQRYKFKDNLKVLEQPKTFKQLEKEIKDIEKSKEIGE